MDHENDTDGGRREFLKIAAVGAVGAMALPGCNDSAAADAPPARTVTVVGVIDIAQALADGSLDNNLYWLDNNASVGSKNLGTANLQTALRRGDQVVWVVSGLEVETSADIKSITGAAAEISVPTPTVIAPGVTFWMGKIAATAIGSYEYRIGLMVEKRLMTSAPLSFNVL